jgi:hypothetical protein
MASFALVMSYMFQSKTCSPHMFTHVSALKEDSTNEREGIARVCEKPAGSLLLSSTSLPSSAAPQRW